MGRLRYEIQYYRQCFEVLQRLRDKSSDVYQQMFLAQYLDHDYDRLDDLMTELHRMLEESVRLEVAAKRVWIDSCGIDHDEKENRKWI